MTTTNTTTAIHQSKTATQTRCCLCRTVSRKSHSSCDIGMLVKLVRRNVKHGGDNVHFFPLIRSPAGTVTLDFRHAAAGRSAAAHGFARAFVVAPDAAPRAGYPVPVCS